MRRRVVAPPADVLAEAKNFTFSLPFLYQFLILQGKGLTAGTPRRGGGCGAGRTSPHALREYRNRSAAAGDSRDPTMQSRRLESRRNRQVGKPALHANGRIDCQRATEGPSNGYTALVGIILCSFYNRRLQEAILIHNALLKATRFPVSPRPNSNLSWPPRYADRRRVPEVSRTSTRGRG